MIRTFVKSLKYAGTGGLPAYDINRSICIGVNLLCLYVILLNFVSGAIFYFLSKNILIPIGAYLEAVIVYGIIELNRRKRFTLANFCFYITISVATFYFTAILGRVSESQLMILFLFGLIYYLFSKRRIRNLVICFNLLLLVCMEVNSELEIIPPTHFSVVVQHVVRWLVYAVVISLTLKIFQLYRKNTQMLIDLHSYHKTVKASLIVEEERNELKNLLFQHIAHDLRGPYIGVSTEIYALHAKSTRGAIIRPEDTLSLINASNQYREMLEDFMELSKFKDASFNEIDLQAIDIRAEVAKIVSKHKHSMAARGVTTKIEFSTGFPDMLIADKLKFGRIVHNLLTNAIKFTEPNTVISIRIQNIGDWWQFRVRDQGRGIKEDKVGLLFKPYVTEKTPANPDGVGLGLYIVKYLVNLMGAKIIVETQPTGTAFDITFPMKMTL